MRKSIIHPQTLNYSMADDLYLIDGGMLVIFGQGVRVSFLRRICTRHELFLFHSLFRV